MTVENTSNFFELVRNQPIATLNSALGLCFRHTHKHKPLFIHVDGER